MTEPAADGGPISFLDSLGDRGRRRAEPRAAIALAGAGCALAVVGLLVVSGDTGLSGGGDFNRVPGLLLSALIVVVGGAVLTRATRGPVATAGTVAAASGVPPFMFFLTFHEGNLPPYSTEGILVVSTIAWLGAYVIGPARGRPFLLGAGLVGFWATILQLTEDLFDAPFNVVTSFVGTSTDFTTSSDLSDGSFDSGPSFDPPDPTTIGILSLLLGVAFLLTARWLDTDRRHGVATPFTLVGIPALLVGVLSLADDLNPSGVGLLLLLIGCGLAYHGGSVGRRATTWIGGAFAAIGMAVFLTDMGGDDATVTGMLFLAGGISLVLAGHAVATTLGEADEMRITDPSPVGAASVWRAVVAPTVDPTTDGSPSVWAPPPPAERADGADDTTDDAADDAADGSPDIPPPPPA